jgi:hypothetical protein
MGRTGKFTVAAAALLIALVVRLAPFSDVTDIAHESTQLHLRLTASSMYEYHSRTGQWPTQIEDLAKTSLPQRSPYWRQMLAEEVNVIVWHKSLKPDPRANAGHILVYHNKGLIATRGRSWVCWGDLRTEYIPTEDLRAYLHKRKE